MLGLKKFGSKKCWVRKHCGSEKWCIEKYFVSENFLDPKFFCTNTWLNFKPRSHQAEHFQPKSCSHFLSHLHLVNKHSALWPSTCSEWKGVGDQGIHKYFLFIPPPHDLRHLEQFLFSGKNKLFSWTGCTPHPFVEKFCQNKYFLRVSSFLRLSSFLRFSLFFRLSSFFRLSLFSENCE